MLKKTSKIILKGDKSVPHNGSSSLLETLISEVIAHFVLLSSMKHKSNKSPNEKVRARDSPVQGGYVFKEVINARALSLLGSNMEATETFENSSSRDIPRTHINDAVSHVILDNVTNHPDIISRQENNESRKPYNTNWRLSIWIFDILIEFLENKHLPKRVASRGSFQI